MYIPNDFDLNEFFEMYWFDRPAGSGRKEMIEAAFKEFEIEDDEEEAKAAIREAAEKWLKSKGFEQ